ncbi:MAG: TIGR04283 family arsenosugar biosynthesis glycosyltransferase [Acidobacteriales bacterium]|nr:TIGR04283 family arsenosugar biosynthesis glycosyltransferase [Terriglobales bacterium]
MNLSVVIPVLNERACLPATVESVRRTFPASQLIVVDGGSTDRTRDWATSQPDIEFIEAPRGRGPQQNAGAARAIGDTLLFLHADCQLPAVAAIELERAVADTKTVGGCFFVRFVERRPVSLHVLSFAMNLRATILRRCFGDQALFVRRRAFDQFGGFPDWPLFEDHELVRRMKRYGRFEVITSPITLSARRFLAHGVWRTVARVFVLQAAFYLGVSAARLKRWFVDIRPHLEQTEPADESHS